MSESLHAHRFPGESEAYRSARNELLQAEMNLRRNIEEVAALRHKMLKVFAVNKFMKCFL